MAALFLKILLSHIIGDFCVQPGSWIDDKNTRKAASPFLYAHVSVHAMVLALVLG